MVGHRKIVKILGLGGLRKTLRNLGVGASWSVCKVSGIKTQTAKLMEYERVV